MPFPKAITRFNKHVTNRLFLLFAGKIPPFAVIAHVGRRSGRVYRTPVLSFPTEDGFLFALTYGSDVDWVKNLLAAGGGGIEYGGGTASLSSLRVAPYAEAKGMFPSWVRPSLWLISVQECLHSTKTGEGEATNARLT